MPSVLGVMATIAAAAAVAYLLPENDRKNPDARSSKDFGRQSGGRDAPNGVLGAGRGRLARGPSEIPVKGWKDILYRVYSNISDHRVLALAAAMTFYSLLAIFPALAALVATTACSRTRQR